MIVQRRAFTMLELLVASAIAVILAGGVLSITAGLARDRHRMQQRNVVQLNASAAELIRWDLIHAAKVMQDGARLTLVGNGEIDRRRLRAGGGLVRVTYRIEASRLVREQIPLDDPLRRGSWRELVGVGVESLAIDGVTEGTEVDAPASGVLRVGLAGGGVTELKWRR